MPAHTLFAIPADSLSWTGLLHALQHLPDFQYIGHTTDARQAIQQASCLRPDVMVMPLNVGGESTVSLAERLRAVSPASKIVVITDEVGRNDDLARLGRCRVHGYLLCRTLSLQYLEWSLHLIADADVCMVSRPVLDAFVNDHEQLCTLDGGVRVSPRQRDVLGRWAPG